MAKLTGKSIMTTEKLSIQYHTKPYSPADINNHRIFLMAGTTKSQFSQSDKT